MSEYPEVDRLAQIHVHREIEYYALRDAADQVDTAARILRRSHITGPVAEATAALLASFHPAIDRAKQAEREAAKAVNAAYVAATGDPEQAWTS